MKPWFVTTLVVATIVVAGAAAWQLLFRPSEPLELVDPDCDRELPFMAINLYGDLRQDDVAVVHRGGKVERLTTITPLSTRASRPTAIRSSSPAGAKGLTRNAAGS